MDEPLVTPVVTCSVGGLFAGNLALRHRTDGVARIFVSRSPEFGAMRGQLSWTDQAKSLAQQGFDLRLCEHPRPASRQSHTGVTETRFVICPRQLSPTVRRRGKALLFGHFRTQGRDVVSSGRCVWPCHLLAEAPESRWALESGAYQLQVPRRSPLKNTGGDTRTRMLSQNAGEWGYAGRRGGSGATCVAGGAVLGLGSSVRRWAMRTRARRAMKNMP